MAVIVACDTEVAHAVDDDIGMNKNETATCYS